MKLRLIPQETGFFDLFERASNNLMTAAQLLVDTVEKFEELPDNARRMERLEHEGDQITHDILARLHRSFKVSQPNGHVQALARLILKQVEEIHQIMPHLRRLREDNILKHCIEINRLENQADSVLRSAVAELFGSPDNLLDVMKWREIYDLMETATDKSEDVANVIEAIVLKNE
jgi:uncharacterized protein Yka (UPF0111/DUF47 family)